MQINQEITPEFAAMVFVAVSVAQTLVYIRGFITYFWNAVSTFNPGVSKRFIGIAYFLFWPFLLYNIITRFQEFSGEVVEACLMIVLAIIWMLQPAEGRDKMFVPMVIVVCGLRFIPLLERANEWDLRLVFTFNTTFLQFAPFLVLFVVENKINRKLGFDWSHIYMSHMLTLMALTYFVLQYFDSPSHAEFPDKHDFSIAENELAANLQVIGFMLYGCVFLFTFIQLVMNKVFQKGHSWEYISVLYGIYMLKGGLLIGARTGPAFYTSLLVIIYYFGELMQQRHNYALDDRETTGLVMFFMYWFVTIVFYRSGHREDFTAIQFGKVCPGGIFCGDDLHWLLIFYEMLAPIVIALNMLPLIVRHQRIPLLNQYAQSKKEDERISTDGLKGIKLSDLPKQQQKSIIKIGKKQYVPNTDFLGMMPVAMTYFQYFVILQILFSSIHVYMTRNQPVFDRIGPKFIFDSVIALLWNSFVIFWT
jgi:hypothetical protein